MKEQIFKVMKGILLILPVASVILVIWNFFCKKRETAQMGSAYGQELEVAGHKMVADVK